VTYRNYEGMIHGFFWMGKVVPQGQQLVQEIAAEAERIITGRLAGLVAQPTAAR
jgi:hypothetical protein